MDKKSKIIVGIFILIIVFIFSYKFYLIILKQEYRIKTYVSCDLSQGPCFKYLCSEEFGPDCEEEVYLKIIKNIKNVEMCNQYEEDCPELNCLDNEKGCEIIYCSNETVEEGEECVYREQDINENYSENLNTQDDLDSSELIIKN